MHKFFVQICCFLAIGALVHWIGAEVVATNNPLDDRDDVRDLRQDARKLLKKPPPAKPAQRDTTKIRVNFHLPDYRKRARKDKIIQQMKKQLSKFNNNPDSDEAMHHFGEPGTFVWLQGKQPLFIYGPDCYSRIIRENKEENELTHIGFFGKFLNHIRRTNFRMRRRKIHEAQSRKLLKSRITHMRKEIDENERKLKERILAIKHTGKPKKHSLKRNRKDALLDFLHLKPKRKLMGPPAMAQATFDDSYLRIVSFARPPEQQSSLVRPASDNSTDVVQMNIRLPSKFYREKKKKYK